MAGRQTGNRRRDNRRNPAANFAPWRKIHGALRPLLRRSLVGRLILKPPCASESPAGALRITRPTGDPALCPQCNARGTTLRIPPSACAKPVMARRSKTSRFDGFV